MKKIIFTSIGLLLALLLLLQNKVSDNKTPITDAYPWQIKILEDGRTSVFGIVLGETNLTKINFILKTRGQVALFESDGKLTLEAYYKNVTRAGLTGSYVFTLDVSDKKLNELKQQSIKGKPTETKSIKYEFGAEALKEIALMKVRFLSYIPTVQIDEEMIVKRFGEPAQKLPLKTKEEGAHYLYPEKGLDLIYRAESKEVLQYTQPADFNLLLEPLKSN